ncbi:MFS transporter [Streptomyces sp. P6-2-1]|uniref:MFS transporter n=1 Tax=unclassified Streptomyces TaxID=2593676 RepID=UPI003D359C24
MATLAPPRSRVLAFRLLWASVTVSALGDGIRFVAMPLLASRVTGDPRLIALVAVAGHVSWLLSPLAGLLADRLPRRPVIVGVDAGRALLAGLLAWAVAAGQSSVGLLTVATFLLGCGEVLYAAACAGTVPALVGTERLAAANARVQSSAILSDTLLGPPLGAVLLGAGAAVPLGADALSFALAAGLVACATLPGRRPAAPLRGRVRAEAQAGLRLVAQDRAIRRSLLGSAVFSLVTDGLAAMLVVWTGRVLGLGDLGYALLVAAFAVGGLAGAAAAPLLPVRVVLRAAPWCAALAAALAATAHGVFLAGLTLFAYGLGFGAWNVHAQTERQKRTPVELMGRAGVAGAAVCGLASATGAVLAGALTSAAGPRAAFAAGGAALGALALWWGRRGR